MAMFPDSGVPPADAKNSLPDVDTDGCDELWYSTSRCQPRFDPAAANAMLAETMNLIMKGEVKYKCLDLNNVERAVRYITQRGLPQSAIMAGGPNVYTAVLDPKMTRYNDYFILTGVPLVNNGAGVTLNIDGLGARQVVRPDGTALRALDMRSGVPHLVAYYAGRFYLIAPTITQEPPAQVDAWIRTDGNDVTGDGSENLPEKAFRTVGGAWQRIENRFRQFPLTTIVMRLGIPGTYEGGQIGPFGGHVVLMGDINNASAYKISTPPVNPPYNTCLAVRGMQDCELQGITVLAGVGGGMRVVNSTAFTRQFRVEGTVSPGAALISIEESSLGLSANDIVFDGMGHTIGAACIMYNGLFTGATGAIHFRNMTVSTATLVAGVLSAWATRSATVISSAVIGPQYDVRSNSVISMSSQPPPGTLPGSEASGGVFIP